MAVSLNKTETALPHFKIALEANPNQGQFWLSYVDALIKEKQFDNARNVLEQGKKRGLAGEKVDFLDAQLVQLNVNLKSQKTEPNKLSKAIELREMGRYQEAQNWLNKFLQIEPTDAEGWSLLSQLFILDNKDQEAEKALSTAKSINDNLPSIYRNPKKTLGILSLVEIKHQRIIQNVCCVKNTLDFLESQEEHRIESFRWN